MVGAGGVEAEGGVGVVVEEAESVVLGAAF